MQRIMPLNPNKDHKMFFSIGEVADMFDVSETLLRYWEKVFPTIAPRKSGRNIRQYSQEDIEEIRMVHNLVKVRGMKLAAAKETLRKNREGASSNTKMMQYLMEIREQLVGLKKELERNIN